MSKKINADQIMNELKGSSSFFADQQRKNNESDGVTSQSDITTSQSDVIAADPDLAESNTPTEKSSMGQPGLDAEKLQTVIKSLSEIPTTAFTTPVRLSAQEKKDIEDFIYLTLRKNELQGNGVSISKLMRYSLRYLMKIHEEEFVEALKAALKKDTSLPI